LVAAALGQECHAQDVHGNAVESVVAAGDIARWPNLRFDTTPRRVEHWINTIEMGQAAAEALLAGPQGARPFTRCRDSGPTNTASASNPWECPPWEPR
jgi:hypothetical protein